MDNNDKKLIVGFVLLVIVLLILVVAIGKGNKKASDNTQNNSSTTQESVSLDEKTKEEMLNNYDPSLAQKEMKDIVSRLNQTKKFKSIDYKNHNLSINDTGNIRYSTVFNADGSELTIRYLDNELEYIGLTSSSKSSKVQSQIKAIAALKEINIQKEDFSQNDDSSYEIYNKIIETKEDKNYNTTTQRTDKNVMISYSKSSSKYSVSFYIINK